MKREKIGHGRIDFTPFLRPATQARPFEAYAPSVTRVSILGRFVRQTKKKERLLVVYTKTAVLTQLRKIWP